jgi:hypothetical protein
VAIERFREQPRAGCFTNAARAREQIRVVEALMLDGVPKRSRYRFLACYFVECLRTPLASDYLIGHGMFSWN